jgi:hypothetical protein
VQGADTGDAREPKPAVLWAIALAGCAAAACTFAIALTSDDLAQPVVHAILLDWITLPIIGIAPIVFLAGLLEARLVRSAVGDLLVELRKEPAPAELRDVLARAMGDHSLTSPTGCRSSGAGPTWTAGRWTCGRRVPEGP